MRIREIITEGRDAYLFHGTDLVSAISILAANKIDSSSQYDHNPTGVSLTRDYVLARDFGTYWERQFPVVFVLDQQKLVRSRHKVLPRQDSYPKGEIVPAGTQGKHIEQMDQHTVDNSPVYRGREAEEMVLSDIYPLSDYLVSINVSSKHLLEAGTDPEFYSWMAEEGRIDLSRKKFFVAIHQLSVHPLLNRWVHRVQWAKNAEQIPESANFQRVDNEYFNGEVEVFTNPSRTTFMKMLNDKGSARGFLDMEKQEVHVWFEAALHGDVEADGSVWLTWNEPKVGELLAAYDSEWFFDNIGEDDDLWEERIKNVKSFARLAYGFKLRVESH